MPRCRASAEEAAPGGSWRAARSPQLRRTARLEVVALARRADHPRPITLLPPRAFLLREPQMPAPCQLRERCGTGRALPMAPAHRSGGHSHSERLSTGIDTFTMSCRLMSVHVRVPAKS
jgi:hypothetical protein